MHTRTTRTLYLACYVMLWVVLLLLLSGVSGAQEDPPPIRNVILFVGDGMGTAHIEAASYYATNTAVGLTLQTAPVQNEMVVISPDQPADSAATGTALATGRAVNNGLISQLADGTPLETLVEHYQARCKSTGLVTTAFLTHATPATFAAHEPSRFNYRQIARDYLLETRPRLLFGGGGNGLTPAETASLGYAVVTDRAGWDAIQPTSTTRLSAQFGDGHFPFVLDGYTADEPTLAEMTAQALAVLEDDPDGFFLVVESSRIEDASLANDMARMIPELLALDTAVSEALNWAADRDDTLIVVTADHEAGGLTVSGGNGVGQLPSHHWTTQTNTAERVPFFIWGETAITAVPLNVVMYGVLKQASSASPAPQNCDLRLHTAVDTPQPRPVEDPLTLSWHIQNQSVWRTEGAVFSSTIPAELVAGTLSSTLPITPTGTAGQWQLPPLAPQEGLTLTLTAVVTANVPVSTALVSTAVVSGTVTDVPAYTVRELQAITLTVANIQPITRTDLYFFAANQTQEIPAPGLLGNDFDWNGDEITAVLSVGPPNAETFALQPDGSFVYTPRPGFAGLEVFQYLAYDPHGGWGIGEVRFYVGEQVLLPLVQR